MKVDILLGLQWGDEGKGKVVDYLAPKYDIIARFQGGPNAGHTLEFDGIKHVLHQIPSGIFHGNCLNIIGNGVVLDPVVFRKEIEALYKLSIDPKKNLLISNRCHLILPTHKLLDKAYEEEKGEKKIGSTLKGIGPAYGSKIARAGLRLGDILSNDFEKKFSETIEEHKAILEAYEIEVDDHLLLEFKDSLEFIKDFEIGSTEYVLNNNLKKGKRILAEGAQGSLLDVDFGSYPFVTSSNTTVSGVCSGLGIPPRRVDKVYGIFKAYCTRVGSGPFPTELLNDVGEKLQKQGNEFGATTGRPRRCGWLDLVSLNYSCMINGVTDLFMMKTDVLEGFDEINVANSYTTNDEKSEELPFSLEHVTPSYKNMKGWSETIADMQTKKLTVEVLDYIAFIEHYLETPINLVSYGPDRKETVFKKDDSWS
ncbi:MAG: adenylosuccinate synthase [Bacteroidota bacterium]